MNELNDVLADKLISRETLEIIKTKVENICNNPPTIVCANVILNGDFALKYAILKEIMLASTDMNEDEVAWYILCNGIEKEYEKMYRIGVSMNDPRNNI